MSLVEPKYLIMTAFILAGVVGGLYAIMFLKWGVKITSLVEEHSFSTSVGEFLRRLS